MWVRVPAILVVAALVAEFRAPRDTRFVVARARELECAQPGKVARLGGLEPPRQKFVRVRVASSFVVAFTLTTALSCIVLKLSFCSRSTAIATTTFLVAPVPRPLLSPDLRTVGGLILAFQNKEDRVDLLLHPCERLQGTGRIFPRSLVTECMRCGHNKLLLPHCFQPWNVRSCWVVKGHCCSVTVRPVRSHGLAAEIHSIFTLEYFGDLDCYRPRIYSQRRCW